MRSGKERPRGRTGLGWPRSTKESKSGRLAKRSWFDARAPCDNNCSSFTLLEKLDDAPYRHNNISFSSDNHEEGEAIPSIKEIIHPSSVIASLDKRQEDHGR